MADYWGIREINIRMGWRHSSTPVRQMKEAGFLMYKRRRGSHPRLIYFTNDQLITAWEIARCKADRDRVLERETSGSGAKLRRRKQAQ